MAGGVSEDLLFRDCVANHELAIDAVGFLAVGAVAGVVRGPQTFCAHGWHPLGMVI